MIIVTISTINMFVIIIMIIPIVIYSENDAVALTTLGHFVFHCEELVRAEMLISVVSVSLFDCCGAGCCVCVTSSSD